MTQQQLAPEFHLTKDGSLTLYNPSLGEHYHSTHGALQESRHIFIGYGLLPLLASNPTEPLHILEVGFGTGLNALLSWREATRVSHPIHYTTLELYPLEPVVYEQLHFDLAPQAVTQERLQQLHRAQWDKPIIMDEYFTLHKRHVDLTSVDLGKESYDLIYFDAFSPEAQPELWSEEGFIRIAEASALGAVLTTYCAKGEVRRRLQRAGFMVERLAGPPGKREVLRATLREHPSKIDH